MDFKKTKDFCFKLFDLAESMNIHEDELLAIMISQSMNIIQEMVKHPNNEISARLIREFSELFLSMSKDIVNANIFDIQKMSSIITKIAQSDLFFVFCSQDIENINTANVNLFSSIKNKAELGATMVAIGEKIKESALEPENAEGNTVH